MRIVKLSEVLKHRKEFIQISDDQSYKLCRVQTNRKGVLLRELKIGALIQTKKQQVCKKDDFIVAEMDAKVGGYGFIPHDLDGSIVSSHYFLFEVDFKKIRKEYLEAIIQTEIIQEQIKAKGSTNYSAIRPKDVLNWEIPLATLDEQEEIEKNFLKIREASTSLLTEIESQKSLLSQLKQSILQEAIQGKLTEEWRALRQAQQAPLEPATELLKRIQAEKARLIKEKKIKKDPSTSLRAGKPLPPITESEKPFELPEGWEWCRLGDLGEINPRNSVEDTVNVSFIPMASISEEFGIQPKSDFSRKWAEVKSGFTHFGEDDVAVAKITPCFENSKAAIFKNLINGVGAGTTELHVFRNVTRSFLNTEFIYLVVKGPLFLKIGESKMTGTAGQKRIPLDFFKNWILAFPPLEEQQAIVEKVESLMEKCRALEEEISQSEQHAQMLMQAVLKEAFEGAPDSQGHNKSKRDHSNKQVKSYQIPPIGELGMVGED